MQIVPRTAVLLALLAAIGTSAQPLPSGTPAEPGLEALKREYLDCDRRASAQRLDPASATRCSVAGEQLLQRGFAGDFDRLLAWWREARTAADPAPVTRRFEIEPASS